MTVLWQGLRVCIGVKEEGGLLLSPQQADCWDRRSLILPLKAVGSGQREGKVSRRRHRTATRQLLVTRPHQG